MLIASLPQLHQADLMKEIISHPCVGAVRYNTGMRLGYTPDEVVRRIQELARPLGKPVWIDLKGRQLRIIEWANLPHGPILLNHRIKVEKPAKVYFRGDDCCELKEVVNGSEIFVDPLPRDAVGQGQSVNIISPKLEIEGGLLSLDHEFIAAGIRYGVAGFMLSFVESMYDVSELEGAIEANRGKISGKDAVKICLKIESPAGVEFIRKTSATKLSKHQLMAARDDLMIHIGVYAMPGALKAIIAKDPEAICASRLLIGLEQGEVSMADISDIEYMKSLGYKDFMLSDGISRNHFVAAIKAWHDNKHCPPVV